MVGAGDSRLRQRGAREFAKSPLHPVARDRVADLLADRIADAQRILIVAARTDEQDEAGHGKAKAAVRGQKFATF